MQDIIATEVAKAKDLPEIRTKLLELFQALRESGTARIGVIAAVVGGDGPEFIEQNLRRLRVYTDYIRSRHPFPVFSAVDIFINEELDKLSHNAEEYAAFWHTLLESGLVTDLFMTPRWDKSQNARLKHDMAHQKGLKIHYWDIFDLYPVYRS